MLTSITILSLSRIRTTVLANHNSFLIFMSMEDEILFHEVLKAYFDCRKNKRNTQNLINFEANYEENCYLLYLDIINRTYEIGTSICFVITKPKPREIFAANFKDRVVHHLVINKLNNFFELEFYENTFNCRKGKGILYGVNQLYNDIKECSENYTKECWVCKFDFKNFFMSINKDILYNKLEKFINKNYTKSDKETILWLVKKIVYHCPQNNCQRKSVPQLWDLLSKDKSLFSLDDKYGLAIGNLTSLIFANFFLNDFDHFVASVFKYYGRYVDDFYIINLDKSKILKYINKLKDFVNSERLVINPKKIYLLPYYKGCSFIGSCIKSRRKYIGSRTIKNCYNCILYYNSIHNKEEYLEKFILSLNSYFGYLLHYKSFHIKLKLYNLIDSEWSKCLIPDESLSKFIIVYDKNIWT